MNICMVSGRYVIIVVISHKLDFGRPVLASSDSLSMQIALLFSFHSFVIPSSFFLFCLLSFFPHFKTVHAHIYVYMLCMLPWNMKVHVYFYRVLLHHAQCVEESLMLS